MGVDRVRDVLVLVAGEVDRSGWWGCVAWDVDAFCDVGGEVAEVDLVLEDG